MAKKILIVDDEPDIQEMLGNRLRLNGYDVVTAGDGVEAVERANEEAPDLVLLDILMPRVDGFSTLRTLKRGAKTSTIPVIMLTVKGESENIMLAQQLRAADFITKPFEADELLKVIAEHV